MGITGSTEPLFVTSAEANFSRRGELQLGDVVEVRPLMTAVI